MYEEDRSSFHSVRIFVRKMSTLLDTTLSYTSFSSFLSSLSTFSRSQCFFSWSCKNGTYVFAYYMTKLMFATPHCTSTFIKRAQQIKNPNESVKNISLCLSIGLSVCGEELIYACINVNMHAWVCIYIWSNRVDLDDSFISQKRIIMYRVQIIIIIVVVVVVIFIVVIDIIAGIIHAWCWWFSIPNFCLLSFFTFHFIVCVHFPRVNGTRTCHNIAMPCSEPTCFHQRNDSGGKHLYVCFQKY